MTCMVTSSTPFLANSCAWRPLKQTFSSGTKQSSKISSLAGQPFWPIFLSCLPKENPGMPLRTASITVVTSGWLRSS